MLLTIIAILILVIGIIFGLIYINCTHYNEAICTLGSTFLAIGSLATIIAVTYIVISHATADIAIVNNDVSYKGLIERLEKDLPNDTTLYSEIQEWNEGVIKKQKCNSSIWLNWFIPDNVVEELSVIETD